jgi:hypothetical protein
VPNKLTLDSNSNKRMDILRCRMTDTQRAYMELARSDHQLQVSIYILFLYLNFMYVFISIYSCRYMSYVYIFVYVNILDV